MKNLGSLNSWSVIRVVCYLLFVGACVAPDFVGPDSVSVLSFRLGKPAFRHVCFAFVWEFVNSFLSMNLGFRILAFSFSICLCFDAFFAHCTRTV